MEVTARSLVRDVSEMSILHNSLDQENIRRAASVYKMFETQPIMLLDEIISRMKMSRLPVTGLLQLLTSIPLRPIKHNLTPGHASSMSLCLIHSIYLTSLDQDVESKAMTRMPKIKIYRDLYL